LRACRMVECCKRGQFHYYFLSDPAVKQVLRLVRDRQD
jgi:hypothetical protein